MATIEKLLVQIFERKRWIVDQVKHQTLLFDQHLASKCLLDGIAPPPWLWCPSLSSAPNELNKEELISGLLLPCVPSAIPFSGSHCMLYNKPVVTADKGDLPDSFYAEVHPSNKGVNAAGDRLSVSPQYPVNDAGGASSCVQKPEPSAAASLQDEADARMPDVSSEPAQSLAKIEISKSDLPGSFYAEVHPLNEGVNAARDRLSVSPQFPVNNAGGASSCVQKLDSSAVASPLDKRDRKISDISPEPAQSLAKIQRSKSRQRALELRNSAKTVKSRLHDENNTGVFANAITGSEIAPLQPDHVHELVLVESVNINNESCEAEEAKLCDFHSQEKELSKEKPILGLLLPGPQPVNSCSSDDHVPNFKQAIISENEELPDGLFAEVHALSKEFVAADGQSDVHQFPVSDAGCASNGVLDLDSGDSSPQYQRKTRKSDIDPGPVQSLARVQRSKSRQRALELRDSAEAAKTLCVQNNISVYSSVVTGSRIASVESDQVQESEIVKTVDFDNETCEMEEAKVSCSQSKEKVSNIYSGRITRSRSSVLQSSSTEDLSHVGKPTYSGRSSRNKNNVGCAKSSKQQIEENSTFSGKVGGQLTDPVSASPSLKDNETAKSNVNQSPVDEMNHVEIDMTGGSKSSPVGISSLQTEHGHQLELVKPVDVSYEKSVVEEPNVGDFQGRQKGSNIYSGRITRSQSSVQQASSKRDSMNVSNSFCTGRSSSDDQNVGSSKSRKQIRKESLLSAESSSSGAEGSCPQSKRRKVEGQLDDSLPASPSLREKGYVQSNVSKSPVVEMDQNGDCRMIGGSQSSPKLQFDEVEGQLNDFLPASPSLREEGNVQSNVSKSLVFEMDQNGGCHMIRGSQSSPKLQFDEGELCLEGKNSCADTPFTFEQKESEVPLISGLADQSTGDSKGCSDVEAGVADPISVTLDSSKHCTMGENDILLHLDDKFELGNTENLIFTEKGMQERKSHPTENGKFSYSTGSPRRQSMGFIGADQAMPEFEGFILQTDNEQPCIEENISFDKLELPKSTIERASVLEQLCKSACMHTPLSHFATTYKLHRAPNLYQSVPNGLLECMDQRSDLSMNDDAGKQLKVSSFNEEVNLAFEGRSYSDCLPFSSAQSAWDIRKPFTSPIGKLRDRMALNSGSSEKRGSLNPELPCISEENENTQEVAEVFQEGICSGVMPPSVKREPLADITEDPNLPSSVSKAEIFNTRNSIESVKTEYSFTGTCNRIKQKLGQYNSSKKQHTNKVKVSNSMSLGENGINRLRESVRTRFSKPKLSGKPSLRKDGSSLAEKESKRNNIVSNLTSFIPLVQQKQPAAIITGKRDVKVKALGAAEAAKRLAQEKENERKMKKEALKLERARLEQENLKQLELQKKKKEEERKKKEAEIAARKRQREEEEKKEKERKRIRVVEAMKQRRENEEKLRAKKENEVKSRAMDERVNEMKVSKDETGKDNRKGIEMEGENLDKMLRTEPKGNVASASVAGKASIVLEVCETSTDCGDNSKVMSNLDKSTENANHVTNKYLEESYDISPYKCSDDEDEEDDDIPNSKFIPSWASKNRMAAVISSQQRLNPEMIFPRESFCSIAEVLLPRKQQLQLQLK